MMNVEKTIEQNFTDFAAFVAQRRAVPDARDSLKYTARQILHAQIKEGLDCKHSFKKSQKSVAAATAFSYVHGDTSAYSQIIHMGRPLVQRYFLEEILGNGGTPMQSDGYAASRYTECRTSELTSQIFDAINMETLTKDDWCPTYDEEGLFPLVLPSLGYYNICNGSFGSIGVGLISSIPQFNLKEVNHAIIKLILDPSHIPVLYPDFASGGILLNPQTTKDSLAKGEGKTALLRSHIVKNEKENYIDVIDLPYGVYTETICKEIEKYIEDTACPVTSFKDLSKKTVHMRIYGKNLDLLEKWLYKNTSIQKHFTIKMIMLDNGKTPKLFNIKTALQAHIDHAKKVLRRSLEFQLKKLKLRQEIIEGLLKAYSILDDVIATIKASRGRSDSIHRLIENFAFTVPQAEAIVDLRLHRLSSIDIEKLREELENNLIEQEKIQKILDIKEEFDNHLIAKYEEVALKFGDKRRTEIGTLDIYETVDDGSKLTETCYLTYGSEKYETITETFKNEAFGGNEVPYMKIELEDELIILTDQVRGFSRKGSDLFLGVTQWDKVIKLNLGEKVISVIQKDKLNQTNFVEIIDAAGKNWSMHKSYILNGASKRGKKLVVGKHQITKVKLGGESAEFPRMR